MTSYAYFKAEILDPAFSVVAPANLSENDDVRAVFNISLANEIHLRL